MCIAILARPETILQKDVLARCFARNPHGAGFAVAKEGELYIDKGFFDFEQFWNCFDTLQEGATKLVHFRYASAGNINQLNCHPWRIDKDHCMVHNGTLMDFIANPEKTPLSDTGLFNKYVLKPIFKKYRNLWKTQVGNYLLTQCMQYKRNKMVILSSKGDYIILNEEEGVWHEGAWWSNDGFLEFSEYCGTTLPYQLPLPFKDEEEEEVEMICY
jgi:predicted glutamine amidotransferase